MIRSISYKKGEGKGVNRVNLFGEGKLEPTVAFNAFKEWAEVNDIGLPDFPTATVSHFYEELYDIDAYVITYPNGFAYKVTFGGNGPDVWVDEVEGCYDTFVVEPSPSTIDEQYIEFMVNYWCNSMSQVENFMESAQYNPVIRRDIQGRFGHVYEIYDFENDNTSLFEIIFDMWAGTWNIQYYSA